MDLGNHDRDLIESARTATLATVDPEGRPRLVPVCFVVVDGVVWSPIDEKPKSVADPFALARVRDIQARPEVTLLFDRWSEDWRELRWLRLHGRARLADPALTPPHVIRALHAKYPQYLDHDLERRPMIRIEIEAWRSWSAS